MISLGNGRIVSFANLQAITVMTQGYIHALFVTCEIFAYRSTGINLVNKRIFFLFIPFLLKKLVRDK